MNDLALRAVGLGKRYHVGARQESYATLRDSLASGFTAPFRRVGKLLRGQATGAADLDDTLWALRDVSFEVERGEIVGIIGLNGAGKTTLLKILSRITEPTEGYADVNGTVGSLLEVGTGFHPELTGRENIYLNGAILGMRKPEIDRLFDEIIDFSGIERFVDTPVKHYSSGMYVRLAFAVAAHLSTDILLVDEVLSVGDATFQQKCLGKMSSVAGEGRTVLLVSHNMGAITRLCERGMLLEAGQVALTGPAEEVVSTYLSRGQEAAGLAQVDAGEPGRAVIHAVGIANAEGEYTSSLEVHKDFWIEIQFSLWKKIEAGQIAVAILSAIDGTFVFVTTHRDSRPIEEATLLPGTYQARVRVPGNYLNVGPYTLNVRIWDIDVGNNRTSLAAAFHAVTFTLIETGSVAARLSDRRGGHVTPILEWDLSRQERVE